MMSPGEPIWAAKRPPRPARDGIAREPKRSLKELLLAMADIGDDADFERVRDMDRDLEL